MQVFAGALPPDRVVGRRNEGRDRLQQLLAMAERRDADVLEIVAGQPAQKLAVNIVGSKNLGILGETDPAEPPSTSKFSPMGSCLPQFLKTVESWRPP